MSYADTCYHPRRHARRWRYRIGWGHPPPWRARRVDGCRDCGSDADAYMVEDHVWAATGLPPHGGQLCLSCLERRIGRPLRPDDLDDAPLNHPDHFRSSQRLQHLKLRAAVAKGLPLWKWQW